MDIQDIQKLKSDKEIADFIKAYTKLVKQKQNPNRDGMIEALKEALKVGWSDIKTVEASRGETMPTPWEQIPEHILYAKLTEYQQGLYYYAVRKYGEELVKKILSPQ